MCRSERGRGRDGGGHFEGGRFEGGGAAAVVPCEVEGGVREVVEWTSVEETEGSGVKDEEAVGVGVGDIGGMGSS